MEGFSIFCITKTIRSEQYCRFSADGYEDLEGQLHNVQLIMGVPVI